MSPRRARRSASRRARGRAGWPRRARVRTPRKPREGRMQGRSCAFVVVDPLFCVRSTGRFAWIILHYSSFGKDGWILHHEHVFELLNTSLSSDMHLECTTFRTYTLWRRQIAMHQKQCAVISETNSILVVKCVMKTISNGCVQSC